MMLEFRERIVNILRGIAYFVDESMFDFEVTIEWLDPGVDKRLIEEDTLYGYESSHGFSGRK